MSHFYSHITSAIKIIETYNGDGPFAYHLKKHFAANKKYGSKDRKSISSLCYNYFRAGHAFKNDSQEDKILKSVFLCEKESNLMLQNLRPLLNDKINLPLADKLDFLEIASTDIFQYTDHLSEEVKESSFFESFLKQPFLFLRIRGNKKEAVLSKLSAAGIEFNLKGKDCLEIRNSTPIEKVIRLNKEAVVQDASSQKVFNYLENLPAETLPEKIFAWDCCAASGGKSILLIDKFKKNIQLTVSDVRENILFNCTRRLQEAGINIYKKFIADLTNPAKPSEQEKYQVIICDAPCSGSGTWARTPEQLSFFTEAKINDYAALQKKIVTNVSTQLSDGGLLFYITCSVFKKENESVVSFISESSLKLLKMEYIKGYNENADTMFVAVFTK